MADIEDHDHPSLEQVIVKVEHDRLMAYAKKEKEKTLAMLHELTEEFDTILKRCDRDLFFFFLFFAEF